MGSLSIWHWLIVLAIVVLVFGTKKLRGAGSDLGDAVKNFKGALKEGEEAAISTSESPTYHRKSTHLPTASGQNTRA